MNEIIHLGGFTISTSRDPLRKGRVWIEAPTGEGMSIEIALLEPVLQEFFDKHF